MNRNRLYVLCIAAILGCTAACTQPQGAAGDEKAREAEIRAWLDRWAKAFSARDTKAIMSMYAPDVLAYDLVPPLQYAGKDAYGKDYETFLAQYDGPVQVEFSDMHITTTPTLAYSAVLERVTGTVKGQKSDIWVRVTSVYKKVDGNWLDVHDHVSVPTDMATGKSMLDLKP